jgi:hypothetical protein
MEKKENLMQRRGGAEEGTKDREEGEGVALIRLASGAA